MTAKRSIIDYLAEHASSSPDRTAFFFKDQKITFQQLDEASARCRGALAGLGVKAGDKVALVMSEGPEMAIAMLAGDGLGGDGRAGQTHVQPAEAEVKVQGRR